MHTNDQHIQLKQPVWAHKNNTFMKAVITAINKDIITCSTEQSQMIQVKRQNVYQRNPFEQNYDQKRWDLMDIDVVNEPEILENIKRRFQNEQIHSFVENTLLVINPYHYFNQLYKEDVKKFYLEKIIQGQCSMRDFPPHVYSITSQMISQMLSTQKSQAIIISGQSGAGKTQANKQCLRFINFYYKHIQKQTGQLSTSQQELKVQRAIQISNPILQAFGNSKTIRNNNSSRFGKYLSISLQSKTNKIKHAHFYNYLLQKSRIISRSKKQQNFHIFYEFINKLPLEDKLKYNMLDQNCKQLSFEHFNYLKYSDNTKVEYQPHPDVSFQKVRQSINVLPNKGAYDFVCRMLSSVLHLGNLQPYIDEHEDDSFCQIIPEKLFGQIADILMIDRTEFAEALTSYHIRVGHDFMTKHFGTRQVQELINSLAKCLYEKLFNWIIQELNILSSSSLQHQEPSNSLQDSLFIHQKPLNTSKTQQNLITLGFLDIYGFQVLQVNSLQQIFINYTNQRLHQIYLHKIFKQQKQIFQQQSLIQKYHQSQFSDNLKIIELIDYNSLGIFNLLDEWCSVASPDQSSFITKLRYNHKKHENFPPSNFNLPSTLFKIKHTPKEVDYSVVGFRQKNKDLLRNQIKNVLKRSKLDILRQLFTDEDQRISRNQRYTFSGTAQQAKSQQPRRFLTIKYRKQMNQLMADLAKSQLHFIRCIKSNNQKQSMLFQQQVVFNQICYLGILDTIKIKKMGYCIKLSYQNIDKRFKWLVRNQYERQAKKGEIVDRLSNFISRFKNDQVLYGKTKVFFRDFAYTTLIKKYNAFFQDLKAKCHKLISVFIKNVYLKKKERKRRAILKIQRYIKPIFLAKYVANRIKNVKQIQHTVRDFLRRRKVQHRIQNIKTVQSYIKRTLQTRRRLKILQSVQKITKIMKRAVLRKRIQGRLVTNRVIEDLLGDTIIYVGLNKINVIEKFLHTLSVQINKSQELAVADLNVYHIMEEKNFNVIEQYLQGFSRARKFKKNYSKIIWAQAVIKGWIVRRKFKILKKAAITIQRGWRQYMCKKRGSSDMFNQTYKYYFQKLKNQNYGIQSYLYKLTQQQQDSTIQEQYIQYLSKFKDKLSIMYFVVDFESFVDLEICYPYNSWPLNYFRVVKDGFVKDNPVQTLEVSETYTVVTSTNKIYVWGMNKEFGTLENYGQIKPKNQIQSIKIGEDDKLEVVYLGEKDKQQANTKKIFSTIKRKLFIEQGKVFQITTNLTNKIIRFPNNQRISQIACGSSHVIFLSSTKKVYTMGNGKKGQLGHGSLVNQQVPKLLKFSQSLKSFYPVQVSASFSSSIILFNHKKILWFGTNGSIFNKHTPQILDLKTKCNKLFTNQEYVPIKLHSSWSRSMSVIGVSVISFNGRMSNNLSLKNKTIDVLIQKWIQAGIQRINPPYIPSVSDHFQQCHVKLPKNKIQIQPESKRKLKQMKEKIKEFQAQQSMQQFSFSQGNMTVNKNNNKK